MRNLALILGVGVVLRGKDEMLTRGFGHVAAGDIALLAAPNDDEAAAFMRHCGQRMFADGG